MSGCCNAGCCDGECCDGELSALQNYHSKRNCISTSPLSKRCGLAVVAGHHSHLRPRVPLGSYSWFQEAVELFDELVVNIGVTLDRVKTLCI
jgi:hypothetical protein